MKTVIYKDNQGRNKAVYINCDTKSPPAQTTRHEQNTPATKDPFYKAQPMPDILLYEEKHNFNLTDNTDGIFWDTQETIGNHGVSTSGMIGYRIYMKGVCKGAYIVITFYDSAGEFVTSEEPSTGGEINLPDGKYYIVATTTVKGVEYSTQRRYFSVKTNLI